MRTNHRLDDIRICTPQLAARVPWLSSAIAVLVLACLPPPTIAGTFVAFEHDYYRVDGKPVTETYSFEVLNPNTSYSILVHNGGPDGQWMKVSAATIGLNGIRVISTKDFNGELALIDKPIALAEHNELSVQLRSEVGSGITVQVIGVDNDAPTITATVSPEPNANGWNNTDVTIEFTCEDAISGIFSCTEPVVLSSESVNHEIVGTAVDNAGNSEDATVTVRLDKSPPVFTRPWPPVDAFSTDLAYVDVEGNVEDGLSGTESIFLRDEVAEVGLMGPEFSVTHSLMTDIPFGDIARDNLLELEATDFAGNVATEQFVVRYTEGAHITPSDPAEAEVVAGLLTSVNRALISFVDGVSRNNVEVIANTYGGRVAGFLPSMNMALVVFETEHSNELMTLIQDIQNNPDVRAAAPVVFAEVEQFDNDLLPNNEAAAYDNINLSAAAAYVAPRFPVKIAIIDSGLDLTYGQYNELSSITLYDLCTLEGQQGIPGLPVDNTRGHGTKMAGIIAGANNSYGNNGVIRGFAGGQFEVSVLRTICDNSGIIDFGLEMMAMHLIIEAQIIDVDVVNMSYSKISETISGQETIDDAIRNCLIYIYRDLIFRTNVGKDIVWVVSAGRANQSLSCDLPIHDPSVEVTVLPAWLSCWYENVIAVGGYDPVSLMRAAPSSFGGGIGINAPAVGVLSAVGPGAYGGVDGTSPATALVSGAAALLLSANDLDASMIKSLMRGTAQTLADPDLTQGGLDVLKLVQAGGTPLSRQSFSGESDGGQKIFLLDDRPLPSLTGFYFNFDNDDHEIDAIEAGFYPLNDPNPQITMWGMVRYEDKNGDDGYSWQVDAQTLPFGTTYHTRSGCESGGSYGSLTIPNIASDGRMPVLTGFAFSRDNEDHHMDAIKVYLSGFVKDVYIQYKFEDKNHDDAYCWMISFAMVPMERVLDFGSIKGGAPGGSMSASLNVQQPVLQGFSLDFDNDDHHLNRIGVRLDPNEVTVWYDDKNHDDDFDWEVWWVDLK